MFKNMSGNAEIDVTKADMQDHFLELAQSLSIYLNSYYLVGSSIGNSTTGTLLAWFNMKPIHSAPLALNLLHNAIFRAFLGDDHSVHLANKPIQIAENAAIQSTTTNAIVGSMLIVALLPVMAYVTPFYLMFYIKAS